MCVFSVVRAPRIALERARGARIRRGRTSRQRGIDARARASSSSARRRAFERRELGRFSRARDREKLRRDADETLHRLLHQTHQGTRRRRRRRRRPRDVRRVPRRRAGELASAAASPKRNTSTILTGPAPPSSFAPTPSTTTPPVSPRTVSATNSSPKTPRRATPSAATTTAPETSRKATPPPRMRSPRLRTS